MWILTRAYDIVQDLVDMSGGSNTSLSTIAGQIWSNPVCFGLRTLFYAATPTETSYATLDEVPDYVTQVCYILIIGIGA